ncbi:MAG: hypothetical protein JXX29_13555 [Deltaproteobacteria bacterium]|nr:hypothetical protein [Deltaproteobacteria bacterium]MBN2672705.1 hypothetical protein [Deltaproteobacteria bacterium]
MRRRALVVVVVVSVVVSGYFIAMIPGCMPTVKMHGRGEPFSWDQNAYWKTLETQFVLRRQEGCEQAAALVSKQLGDANEQMTQMASMNSMPDADAFESLEKILFNTAVIMGACRSAMRQHGSAFWQFRNEIKAVSSKWDVQAPRGRKALYRLLYGTRMALEQAMLVSDVYPVYSPVKKVSRHSVPFAEVHGVHIQSGDLLLSRGTAPTSAFIARGNDYPGNFSHVALVHVGERGKVSIIESHIEGGVAVTDVDGYLKDKKFRILVLRLRADVPEVLKDSTLPHKAAEAALRRAVSGHTPYDFEMDYQNSDALFCSEVASSVYAEQGVTLWHVLSSISNPVVVRWMRDFGVRYFMTQAPSDLEYDPQLEIIYEWRSQSGLIHDTVDNAVTDAMIELGSPHRSLPYSVWMLPVARLLKLYSAFQNVLGKVGPVPEGMNATAALRNRAFQSRHRAVQKRVLQDVERFKSEHDYFPPYWRLVEIAKSAL